MMHSLPLPLLLFFASQPYAYSPLCSLTDCYTLTSFNRHIPIPTSIQISTNWKHQAIFEGCKRLSQEQMQAALYVRYESSSRAAGCAHSPSSNRFPPSHCELFDHSKYTLPVPFSSKTGEQLMFLPTAWKVSSAVSPIRTSPPISLSHPLIRNNNHHAPAPTTPHSHTRTRPTARTVSYGWTTCQCPSRPWTLCHRTPSSDQPTTSSTRNCCCETLESSPTSRSFRSPLYWVYEKPRSLLRLLLPRATLR